MKHSIRTLSLYVSLTCFLILSGCGKRDTAILDTSQPMDIIQTDEATQSQEAIPQEKTVTFDYEPGYMGIYVKADPSIHVDAEVLDSITMTLSDKSTELTRKKVSNSQFDFIKQGHQIGGFVLVDIPREMLEKEPNSWEEFTMIVDPIANQVMADAYPSEAYISGGGHLDFGNDLPAYMTFMIQNDHKDQYIHNIYIGEKYIYDFWLDSGWMADGGGTIMETLSAEDIKPELNQADAWNIHDFDDYPGNPES